MSTLGTMHALCPVRLKAQTPTDNRRSELDVQSGPKQPLKVIAANDRCPPTAAKGLSGLNVSEGPTPDLPIWVPSVGDGPTTAEDNHSIGTGGPPNEDVTQLARPSRIDPAGRIALFHFRFEWNWTHTPGMKSFQCVPSS